MKVLVIAQYFPPDLGGGATRAYNVAKGLILNGCEVTVVTAFPHYPHGKVPNKFRSKAFVFQYFDRIRIVRTFILPLASQGLVKRLLLFFSFIISSLFAVPFVGKVDVVWAANPNVFSIFPALFYGLIKRKPVALNVDDLWPEDLCNLGLVREDSLEFRLMRFIAKFAYSKARLITPISPGYVGVLCGNYGVNQERVQVVGTGVDLDMFSAVGERSNCSEVFKVLYSGALSIAYDFDQVLLAAKMLEKVDGVEFVLQGGGELLGYVKSRVKELKLSNVRVIDKILSRLEVAKLLSEADALILPLRDFGKPYLGISSKLYEYQAVGKPIICCSRGMPSVYVKKTNSGLVVYPGDYDTLAKAVIELKKNSKLAQMLGKNGRKYVETEASIEAIGLKMKKIFEAQKVMNF
ncbi:MAG: glycosyltransferase family 4 protein [Candidatus Aenigmatarchaeota archaeon]